MATSEPGTDGAASQSLAALAARGTCLVSLGVPLGITVDPADPGPIEATVRVGRREVALAEDVFSLYLELLRPLTEQEARELAPSVGVADGAAALGVLTREQVIASLSPREMAPEIQSARVISSTIGIGNSDEDPNAFQIADLGSGATLIVDPVSFALWAAFDGRATVIDACRALAAELSVAESDLLVLASSLVLALLHMRMAFLEP